LEKDLNKADKEADLIPGKWTRKMCFQTRPVLKIEANLKPSALVLSSSSSIVSSIFLEKMRNASRC